MKNRKHRDNLPNECVTSAYMFIVSVVLFLLAMQFSSKVAFAFISLARYFLQSFFQQTAVWLLLTKGCNFIPFLRAVTAHRHDLLIRESRGEMDSARNNDVTGCKRKRRGFTRVLVNRIEPPH